MKHQEIVFYHHPITIILLDDNKNFLESLEFELGKKFMILPFTNPEEVLTVLNMEEEIGPEVFNFLNNSDSDGINDILIDIDVKQIHKYIYNTSRFSYPGIIIVDYNMPLINGIDFCRNIKDKNLLKIMLTAEAGKETAINAFNEGIIDKFIFKQSKGICEELSKAIDELTNKYFIELTKPLMINFRKKFLELLKHPEYLKIFNYIFSTSSAVEYYLLDKSGSFLFLDGMANPTWLIIRSNEDYEEQIQILEGADAPEYILSPIKNREKLLFLLSDRDHKKPIAQWKSHMFESKCLKHGYYYTVIHGNISNAIDENRVLSYVHAISKTA